MRERINRLARGIIDSEIPQIVITPASIEETVRSGGTSKGEFAVLSGNGLNIKGLIYSSNIRVKVKSSSFGGVHNHISYEVNCSYLEDGDEIRGSFYLVTNGGEREIPYCFSIEFGTSGRTLKSLRTAADFAAVAGRDMETALLLFEYQDFVEAPFMKELHIRALYDGLKGRPDRRNELEEFLVALQVKEPVEITVDCEEKVFENPLEITQDHITVKSSGWGYIHLDASAEGDFIELPKKLATDSDFTDGRYELQFKIHPQRLHRGRNFGRILITAPKASYTVMIEADGDETVDISDGEEHFDREGFARYLRLRLDYESGLYEAALLQNKMLKELEGMENLEGRSNLLTLLRAECEILTDKPDTALALLGECRDAILSERQDQREHYCYYQYLRLLASPNDSQKESLIRLLNKYLEEEKDEYRLFLLLVKLDERLFDNPGMLLGRMKRLFKGGLRSPFLYVEAAKLLNRIPELLRVLDSFELQVLSYAAKSGMAQEKLALAAARLAVSQRYYNHLLYKTLVKLYERFPCREILEAVISLLIKGECMRPDAFIWYERGVSSEVSLTRLYEYFLYSLPSDYDKLLPKEVLLYFSYGNELDRHNRSVLYTNILNYMDPSDELYRIYERDMEQFAMDQLFESRINSRLAVIYEHMIYKDVIDVPVARVLPSVLKSFRVECANPLMKFVVVCYEELLDEDAYPLKNGVAYVPLFSENSVLMFQDAYGNRYASETYSKRPVMEEPELLRRCFEVYPDHPMLRLRACADVVRQGARDEEEVGFLEQFLDDTRLHPLYQKTILKAVLTYYENRPVPENGEPDRPGQSYLLRLNKAVLTREERLGVCETLIAGNYIKEAYEMIREYGCEGLSPKRLMKLCNKMILKNLFDQDERLLHMAYQVFCAGRSDSVVLDYLCEHFNGLTDQMYKVLMQGVCDHVETYDLEERLLAQMIFSGTTENMDKVFSLYLGRKKTSEVVVKAYFTEKSAEYFLEGKTPDDQVFSYLEGAVNGSIEKDKVPTIYLLALTKYYSSLKELSGQQKTLCESMTAILLEEGLVFPYFKALAKFQPMPEDIMDKGMIEYHGARESKVDLQVRILPDEEEYHGEDMRRIYQGIFVKQKVLFEGEIMEYQVYEQEDGGRVLKAEGSVTYDAALCGGGDSRFACLNEMGLCLNLKEEERLKEKMKEYLKKNAAAEELFQLM